MISNRTITYNDSGADALGRRSFTLTWDDDSEHRPQPHPMDGKPVGHRRGQCYFASPDTKLWLNIDGELRFVRMLDYFKEPGRE